MTPRAYLWFFAAIVLLALVASAWPDTRTAVDWEGMQTCLYARSPETLEAIGNPAMPCSRNDIPGFTQSI